MKTALKESIDLDEIASYLEQWRDSEGFSDVNLALDRGFVEYAAYILDSAGAIDSRTCYESAQPTERAIERLLKRYTDKQRKRDLNALLKNTEIWVHRKTNEHYFVPRIDVDYFVGADDLRRTGYVFQYGYDARGREYKRTKL